jgi:hypothetical protein
VQLLTDSAWQKVLELGLRYGVSADCVVTLLQAVVNGNGTMAQFSHPELGGGGQWMQGGMTMVGDMFNSGLKFKVDGLCCELSNLAATRPFLPPAPVPLPPVQGGPCQQQWFSGYQGGNGSPSFPGSGVSGNWWPSDLGVPNSSGGQNQTRYAYFGNSRRLAVDTGGHVTVYDTLDHQIGGVSQQQGGNSSLTFTSQYGTVPVANLPVVSGNGATQHSAPPYQAPPAPVNHASPAQEADIFGKIERLAELNQKGIISAEEFAAKKSELLSRL